MTNTLLYLNDQLADLSDDSPIALTFQINNLADVKNQQGNTSNQFKLPLTQRNRQLLGFPDDIAFTSVLPYRQYRARLIHDGLEIIPYGTAELDSIEQDAANITVLSGNVDFFDAIDGNIYDMGDSTSQWSNYGTNLVWKPYDHVWNLDNVVNSQNKTDGWIWPVVDYGLISSSDFTTPIDVRYQRPGFFIKTAIDLLLKSAGYKGTGSLLNDPLYLLLICQFANGSFDHGTDQQNNPNHGITVQTGQNLAFSHPNTSNPVGAIPFSVVLVDPSLSYNPSTGAYLASEITSISIQFAFSLLFTSTNPSHSAYSSKLNIQLRFFDVGDTTGSVIASLPYDYANRGNNNFIAENNQTLSFDTVLQPGQSIKVTYEFKGYSGSAFTMYAGATLTITNKVQTVQFRQTVQCERILPDISQKSFLKDTLQRFGIICQTDNASKTISFNSFRDIVNNIPIAKNWTAKCINQGKQVAFKLGDYAQVNYMQYKTDTNVLPLKFGWWQINIDDQTLAATNTLFESIYGVTLNRPYYGGTIAQIKMIDDTSGSNDFTIGVSPRILIDQKLNIAQTGKTVSFTDGTNTRVVNDIISTPYFYKPDAPQINAQYGKPSLLFNDLRLRYYPELEKILTRAKKIVRYFLLSPRDILELDLLIPVYLQQDGAYYYINKIDSWRKGQPCKVELVKLG